MAISALLPTSSRYFILAGMITRIGDGQNKSTLQILAMPIWICDQ